MASEFALADELRNLEVFAGQDRKAADEAFVRLSDRIERFLWKYLTPLVPLEQEREDVISIVIGKLYSRRSEFQVRGVGPWWAYVATTARRVVYDRAPQRDPDVELSDELPDCDLDAIGNIAELSHFRSQLHRAADELWLGVPEDLFEGDRRRRLLAAQFFYLHGSSWEEVTAVLGAGAKLPRATLDGWLQDPSVLLDLAYNYLYVGTDDLLSIIFRPEKPLSRSELEAAVSGFESAKGTPPEGWYWNEVKVAVWRYRNGLLNEKIRQIDRHLTEGFIESTLEKCRARLPFERRVRDLQQAFAQKRVPIDLLETSGLWRRLVFQYSVSNDLPQRQILERTERPAAMAGFTLTAGVISAWLSNGRLLQQLSSHIKEQRK